MRKSNCCRKRDISDSCSFLWVFSLVLASAVFSANDVIAQTAPKITSLYVIDYGTSRGDTLAAPLDIFFDRVKKELYVADAGKRRILIYDRSGRYRAKIRLFKHYGLPGSLVVDGQGRLYIASTGGSSITVLAPNGDFVKSIDLTSGFHGPAKKLGVVSMALGPEGKIFVLTNLRGVMRIDPENFVLDHVPLEVLDSNGKPRLVMVLVMTVDPEGRFLFGEMRPGSVVVFNREGKYVTRFGESGGGPHQVSRPTGIAVDREGRFYVLSKIRDVVVVFDRNGRYLREWGGPGIGKGLLYSGTRIVYDGEKTLYTLEPDLKRVQAFQVD